MICYILQHGLAYDYLWYYLSLTQESREKMGYKLENGA